MIDNALWQNVLDMDRTANCSNLIARIAKIFVHCVFAVVFLLTVPLKASYIDEGRLWIFLFQLAVFIIGIILFGLAINHLFRKRKANKALMRTLQAAFCNLILFTINPAEDGAISSSWFSIFTLFSVYFTNLAIWEFISLYLNRMSAKN